MEFFKIPFNLQILQLLRKSHTKFDIHQTIEQIVNHLAGLFQPGEVCPGFGVHRNSLRQSCHLHPIW